MTENETMKKLIACLLLLPLLLSACSMSQQPAPVPQPQQTPSGSERGMMALQYLMTHESVGPRDLNAVLQLSESTWSRVLSQLEDQGLISKQGGQKRKLTQAGRQFLGMQ